MIPFVQFQVFSTTKSRVPANLLTSKCGEDLEESEVTLVVMTIEDVINSLKSIELCLQKYMIGRRLSISL